MIAGIITRLADEAARGEIVPTGTTITEGRSDRLQTALDREFLSGAMSEDEYTALCRTLESITEY